MNNHKSRTRIIIPAARVGLAVVALAVVAPALVAGQANAADFTWTGGIANPFFGATEQITTNSGQVYRTNWSNSELRWPQVMLPDTDDRVIFNADATAGGSETAGVGDLRNLGTLDLLNRVNLNGTTIDNRGEILLGGAFDGNIQIGNDMRLTGGGTIRGSAPNSRDLIAGPGTLTVESGNTIRGFGDLSIDIRNQGHLIAEGGTLGLSQSVIDNDDALITIASGAELRLNASGNSGQGDTAIRYGRIHGEVGSRLGGWLDDASIDNAWLTGVHSLTDDMLFRGDITNDSSLGFVPRGSNRGNIQFFDNLRFSGSGEVVLGRHGNTGDIITGIGDDALLINGGLHEIVGNGVVWSDLHNEGRIQPGLGIGVMSMPRNRTFTNTEDGIVRFEVGGYAQGTEHDYLWIDDANFGGTVEVDLVNDFIPTVGDRFRIIGSNQGGIFNDSFDRLIAPELPTDQRWSLQYDRGFSPFVELSVVAFLAGDFNGDGTVDAADYTLWRSTEGMTGPGLFADHNDDHIVNELDYRLWRSNYGNTVGSGGASASVSAVPEPSSLMLIGLLLSFASLRRRAR